MLISIDVEQVSWGNGVRENSFHRGCHVQLGRPVAIGMELPIYDLPSQSVQYCSPPLYVQISPKNSMRLLHSGPQALRNVHKNAGNRLL